MSKKQSRSFKFLYQTKRGIKMLIKVCGFTTLEAAKAAESAGANVIGFLFATSRRKISPEKARQIAMELSPELKKVGVFVNESVENIVDIAKTVGLDYIQLHGDEDAHFAAQIPFPVIKAFSIGKADPKTIATFPADLILLDSPGKQYRGGSGETFNWEQIDDLQIDKNKVILAGGLNEA